MSFITIRVSKKDGEVEISRPEDQIQDTIELVQMLGHKAYLAKVYDANSVIYHEPVAASQPRIYAEIGLLELWVSENNPRLSSLFDHPMSRFFRKCIIK